VRAVARPRRGDQDLHDELSFHLAMEAHANVQGGLSGAEAHRRARRDVGIEQAIPRFPTIARGARKNRSFDEVGAFFGASYNLTGTDRPEVLPAIRMTASLWTVLKSQPVYGRLFSEDAETWGAHRVAVINRIDRNLPLANVRTMDSRLADSLAQRRFVAWLLGAFSALALVLAVVGLYGVMAYTVAQRRQEIGVRVALGATAADVLRLVVTEGLSITAVGVTIGLLLAAGLSRLMTTMLFQVSAIDPVKALRCE
jgi:hypothetical protein